MAGPAHEHLHLQDPVCEAVGIPKQETRRSSRTRPPSASFVRSVATSGGTETQSEIEANIAAERQAIKASMAQQPPAAGSKRSRAGGNGDGPAAATATRGKGAAKKQAMSQGGKPMTKAQLEKHKKKELKAAPETKHLELPSAFVRLLCHTKVEDFQWEENKNKPIFVCKETDTVANVFRGLIKHNLQSVPVTTKDMEKYHAFIDLADIVHYVVRHFGEGQFGEEKGFWQLVDEEKAFDTQLVRSLEQHPYAARNRFHAIQSGFSLFSVFDAMSKIRGLRRVAIVDSKQTLLNLITQSQLIEFLAQNTALLGPKGRKELENCSKELFKPVFTIKENDKTLDGFKLMDEKKVNGIGIVDEHGRLKGNLSTRDLKVVSHDMRMFWRLRQSVKNFVRKLRDEFQTQHSRPQRLVFAKRTDSLESVIKKLAYHKIHRMYIVDARRVPIGVVSLRDVLLELLHESKSHVEEVVKELRQAVATDAHVEELEGYEYEALDTEPVVPAPAIPMPAPFTVPAQPATATGPAVPATLVYPPVPTVPMMAVPFPPIPPAYLEMLAKPPLQITDFTTAAAGGRDIAIGGGPAPSTSPHQQMAPGSVPGGGPVPSSTASGTTAAPQVPPGLPIATPMATK